MTRAAAASRFAIRLCALLLLALAGGILADAPPVDRGTIVVHAVGFSNDHGHARIGLFNRPDGFPMDSTRALTGARVAIHDGEATAVFSGLPDGTYAVIAHHDENDNYKLDVNWLGKPREQYGASNNPRPRLGPPRWKSAAFELNTDTLVVTIKMHY